MIRFERLGFEDFAVYVSGEADAIGKAGVLCGESWFLARPSLGGGLAWEETMFDAVQSWARTRLRQTQLRRLILREVALSALQYQSVERGDEDENGIFIAD